MATATTLKYGHLIQVWVDSGNDEIPDTKIGQMIAEIYGPGDIEKYGNAAVKYFKTHTDNNAGKLMVEDCNEVYYSEMKLDEFIGNLTKVVKKVMKG
jgi:hypothetical protein